METVGKGCIKSLKPRHQLALTVFLLQSLNVTEHSHSQFFLTNQKHKLKKKQKQIVIKYKLR